jgi:hypothetical protein
MNETPWNPYAPPVTSEKLLIDDCELEVWREGDVLVMRTGATLPSICLVTGEPGWYSHRIHQIWQPRWVYGLMFFFLVPYFLVSPFVYRRIEIFVPFGKTIYSKHRRVVRLGMLLVLLSGLILVPSLWLGPSRVLILSAVLLFVAGISLASRYPLQLDVLRVEQDRIYIQKVHPEFLAELPAPFE